MKYYGKYNDQKDLIPREYVDDNFVPETRTVNGKALSANITLTASDVSALSSSTTYVSSVNGLSGSVTVNAVPSSSTSDNGKFLMVVNGVAAWTTVDNANGVSF